MNINLTNKVILVTGASRGIGLAIASALGESGARVAIHYNSNPELAAALSNELPGSIAFKANLEVAAEVVTLFDKVVEKMGRIDVLINNAGIALSSPVIEPDEVWLANWKKTMAVNLDATGLLCKKAIPHFINNGKGIIINISSRAAFRGDTEDYLAYAASKGGIVALTRSIARAYGKQGITAYTIAPGFTRTAMAEQFIDAYGEDYAKNDIALNDLTQPADIAPIIVFLASGMAAHATGATIDVNAGSYVH